MNLIEIRNDEGGEEEGEEWRRGRDEAVAMAASTWQPWRINSFARELTEINEKVTSFCYLVFLFVMSLRLLGGMFGMVLLTLSTARSSVVDLFSL